jgi:hypothetical protein
MGVCAHLHYLTEVVGRLGYNETDGRVFTTFVKLLNPLKPMKIVWQSYETQGILKKPGRIHVSLAQ